MREDGVRLLAALVAVLLWVAFACIPPRTPSVALTHGPLMGHIEPTRAIIWARFDGAGEAALRVVDADGEPVAEMWASANSEKDYTVTWDVEDLSPGSAYAYSVVDSRYSSDSSDSNARLRSFSFETPPLEDVERAVRIVFGSCADDEQPEVWNAIRALHPEAIVFLGDTPYIDSTRLDVQRARYRSFYAGPGFARMLRGVSLYATWDDHDYGENNADGTLEGKANARRAFESYHANPFYGGGGNGIYTRFRRGAVEVFLLDTRYFARTGPSPAASGEPTLLGSAQWEWLKRGLLASTATFKIRASGMVWNGAVREDKDDHWETYAHERDALFRFIGERGVEGVVLVAGDIHRSRVLRYPAGETGVGYDLTELITSLLHSGVMKAANVPSPYLLHDAGVPQSFLLVTVDSTVMPALLTGRFMSADGAELFSVRVDAEALLMGR